jgi:Phage tail tube protein, GTA-gp10
MANKARGEVKLELGGEVHVLRPTFGAVCEIEDTIGTNLFDIGRRLERAEVTAQELVKLTHACIAQSGSSIELDKLGEMIVEQGSLNIVTALVGFCQSYAFGGREEKKADVPPAPRLPAVAAPTS